MRRVSRDLLLKVSRGDRVLRLGVRMRIAILMFVSKRVVWLCKGFGLQGAVV